MLGGLGLKEHALASFVNRIGEPDPERAPVEPDGLLSHRVLIEAYLKRLTFSENPRFATLLRAMNSSLFAWRGRLRSVLCMEVARSFGASPAWVLPSAAAIELMHTLSLIHDELPAVNNNRPGKSGMACHEEFGEATAILAGDGFFGESLALITARQQGTPQQTLMVIRELATSSGLGGMVAGQALQTSLANDQANTEAAHEYRTAAIIEASARIGAILADASEEQTNEVSEYSRRLAVCLWFVEQATASGSSDDSRRLIAAYESPWKLWR